MKNIVVDVYKARGLFTGLGQFSVNFAQALIESNESDFQFNLLVPPNFNREKPTGFNFIEAGFRQRYLPFLNQTYDVWHSLQQFPSHFPNRNTRQILTVHDLNFLVEKEAPKVKKYLERLQKNVDRSVAITAISDSTKSVLEQHIDLKGQPVRTIYNGVKLEDFPQEKPPNYVTGEKFFFAIGVFKAKKNFEVLLPMMKHFSEHQLIIAGSNDTSYGQYLRQRVNELGLGERVVFPGKVADGEKTWLYRHCEAFMMPSLAEGFGLPVIEAMMAETPVFLNTIDALREVGGDVAYYFESFDSEVMAAQVTTRLFEHSQLKKSYPDKLKNYAKRFNWEACISQYLNLYREVLQ